MLRKPSVLIRIDSEPVFDACYGAGCRMAWKRPKTHAPPRSEKPSPGQGLECFEGRMRYELLEGQGPSEGWVTVSLKDKDSDA